MKEETKGTQAERCKRRTMHQMTINQKISKNGRPEEANFVKKQVSLSISKFETPIEC
jgi:hypothetical protein